MRFSPSRPAATPAGIPHIIPHTIHQIWLGGRPLPARWAEFGEGIRALHPGWEYRLWTDEDLPGLWAADPFQEDAPGLGEIFALWPNFGYQSDIVRLLVLWLHGGIYLDTDCEVFRPLDSLADNHDAFVGATFPGEPFPQVLIQNAVTGACPRHPWLTLTLRRLREGLAPMAEDTRAGTVRRQAMREHRLGIIDLTGPGLLSRTLLEYRRSPNSMASDVAVVPARRLFPAGPGSSPSRRDYPDVLLLHHWDNSWGEKPAPPPASTFTPA